MSDATFTLDRWEHTTAVAALIHYALHVAIPDECINVLGKICPDAERPWDEIIGEARAKMAKLHDEADRSLGYYQTDKAAALREP